MLILYPNYSLEIVGNYLAFPFQVVLLVSFKSNLFWLKFLHYEVFNVLAFFKARPLLASFYIVSRISDFVKNFFQRFFLSFFDFFPALFSTPVPMPASGAIVPLPARSNLHSKACFVASWSTGSFVRIRSSQAQNQAPGLSHSYTSWKKRTETVLFLKFISDLPTIAQEKLFVARRQGCEPRSVLIVREKRAFRRQQRHGQF